MKLRLAGEEAVVDVLTRLLAKNWPCRVIEPSDDASCVPGFEKLLVKIDGYSITSAKLPWMSLEDLGWKAAVAAMSDLVAKAAKPLALVVSLGVPGEWSVDDVVSLVKGVKEAAHAHGASLVGGDTNGCEEPCSWIDVAAVGFVEASKPIGRSPRPGDYVYVTTGRLGLTGVALHAFLAGKEPPREAIDATRRPTLRLNFVELARRVEGCISASSDVSDGLAYTLHLLARSAAARVELYELPLRDEVVEYAEQVGADPVELALNGGEEYEIAFTVKPRCVDRVEDAAKRVGLSIALIGRLLEGEPGKLSYRGRVVEVKRWDQFRGYVAVAIGAGSSTPTSRGSHRAP
jgi:thiamine-monophosphate kinase